MAAALLLWPEVGEQPPLREVRPRVHLHKAEAPRLQREAVERPAVLQQVALRAI